MLGYVFWDFLRYKQCVYLLYRLDDAIEILEYVVGTREEKLGTANPEVEDEKQRLAALLKEAGRGRSKRNRALLTLLDKNPEIANGQRPVY